MIHQDARILLADVKAGNSLTHECAANRAGWLQVLRGEIAIGEISLSAGDGLMIENMSRLDVTAKQIADLLLFDMSTTVIPMR